MSVTEDRADRARLAASVLENEESRRAAGNERAETAADDPSVLLGDAGAATLGLRDAVRIGGVPTIGVLFGLNALDELDRAALAVLGPDIQDSLGISDAVLALAASIGGFLVFLAAVPIGYLADRRRRTTIVGTLSLLWSVVGLLTGLVRNGAQLVASRMLSGIGKANEGPVQKAILADAYPIAARNRIFAIHNLANPVGVAIGPILAGGVGALAGGTEGWRWAFVVLSLPAAVVGLAAFGLREPERGANERRAVLGEHEPTDGDPEELAAAERAPELGAAFARLRNIPTFRSLLAGFAALGFGLFSAPVFVNLVLEEEYGLDAVGRGIVGSIVAIGAVVGTILGGRRGDELFRTDPARAVRLTAGAIASLAVTYPLALSMPSAVGYTAVSLATAAVTSFAFVPATGLVPAITPYRLRSVGFAMVGVYLTLVGGIGGALVAGALSDATSPRTSMLLTVPPAAALGGLLLWRGARHVRTDISRAVDELREERDQRLLVAAGEEPPALSVRDVDFSYGPVQVLFDVSLDVRRGEVLALLGTNGAGKSTLLRAVSGLAPVDRGSIRHHGRTITFDDARARVRAGIVQVPGGKAVFPGLTVGENLVAGAYTYIWDRERLDARVTEVLELFPVLRERLDQPAGTLSGGEQQMLAIAKALLLEPDILCIDELSLGLAPVVVQELIAVVEGLRDRGLTMIVVEQSLNVALAIADRAVFMEKGAVRFQGPAAELAERDDLVRAVFLGGEGG